MKYKVGEMGEVIGDGIPNTKREEYYTSNGERIAWSTPKDLSSYSKMYIDHGSHDLASEGYNNPSAKLLPKDSILTSSRAPIRYVAITKNEIATNQRFKSIIPDRSKVYPEYLCYLMLENKLDLERVASGSTFRKVSDKAMKEFKVGIPSLLKQGKILNQLVPIQRRIELNNQVNDNLAA